MTKITAFLALILSATAQATVPFVTSISFNTGDPLTNSTSLYSSAAPVPQTGNNTNPVLVKIPPIIPFLGAASFASFGNPAYNALNGVAFQAKVLQTNFSPIPAIIGTGINPQPNSTSSWTGIWADDSSGTRQLIVRSGDPSPGIGGTFVSFSDPVYNNSNAIAFIGKSFQIFNYIPVKGGQYPPNPATGVWTTQTFNGSNALSLVASLGSPAPGYTTNTTFSSFDQIALPDQGGVVLMATVTTKKYVSWIYPPISTNPNTVTPNIIEMAIVPSSTQQGIWAQDTTGTLQLIAHQGGALNVGGTNKTIASLSFLNSANSVAGQTRSFNQDTGNLFFKATFTDGTQAGVKVIFP